MRALALVAGFLALTATAGAYAGADLMLRDGGVLSGESLERTRDGLYLLTTPDGSVLTIPVELVRSLRLTGGDDPAPTGMVVSEPGNVGGPAEMVPLPRPEKQLAAFGRPPATFAQSSVRGAWWPSNALGPDVSEFHPVRWYRSSLSFDWVPTPPYRSSTDVTQFNPVRWFQAPTASDWRPTDGWR